MAWDEDQEKEKAGKDIWGNPTPRDIHGNPERDIHGNPIGQDIWGNPPKDGWGNPIKQD